ncbi:nitric oxide synthase [Exiguobacterium sp. SH5S4]|uniref:flavodoxin domain-containing protein n=1 Tax=Exiguobacterium sp. SH5S4 TaxID=2510961 RepID=UPI00103EEE5E|nr:flavodoxin domain-containing protein [Exiguobacterium sp. SH5S4]TCI27767.1 nitric oxide synthase [Exiguobacterium sp. SH5S4]
MNVAIVYSSMSGNTEEVAELIQATHVNRGDRAVLYEADRIGHREAGSLATYDLVYFGSYTWADGVLPDEMKDTFRLLLKEQSVPIRQAAVFGTGDKMFVHFCRAVDEMAYHLSKFGIPLAGELLKIEQSPRNQPYNVRAWTERLARNAEEGVHVYDHSKDQTTVAQTS